jgi:hypothetical protein
VLVNKNIPPRISSILDIPYSRLLECDPPLGEVVVTGGLGFYPSPLARAPVLDDRQLPLSHPSKQGATMSPGKDTELSATGRFLMLIAIVTTSLRLRIDPICELGKAS